MSEMTATFDPQTVVDVLEKHRENIMDGQMKQMYGDAEGALGHAIESINMLMDMLFKDMLSEESRRELRQLTADTHHNATYFGLDDDVEWADAWDAAHPEYVRN
jgi:hypothetical protein